MEEQEEKYLFEEMPVPKAVATLVSLALGHLLRSEGHARQASAGMMFGGILNVVLDPVFIFVFHLNVAGAAMATAFSLGEVIMLPVSPGMYFHTFRSLQKPARDWLETRCFVFKTPRSHCLDAAL